MTSLNLAGLSFQKVNSCSVFIGENKGGWIYAGQRPRHEVKLPDFYIMESSLSDKELTEISKKLDIESNSNQWDEGKLNISALAFIRGRSLSNVIFIVDEAQNLTPHEVKTIITKFSN